MSSRPSDSRQVLEDLARAVEIHGGWHGARTHVRVLNTCAEAVEFACEGDPELVGTRAHAAAQLLLELTCPHLSRQSVAELSLACERAAVQLH
jgi:hypothetical protein